MNLTPEQVAEYNRLVEEEGKEPRLEWVKDEFHGYALSSFLEECCYIEVRDREYPDLWTLCSPSEDSISDFTTWKAAALAAEDIIKEAVAPLFEEK